jgi:F0F1-type ATP synthase assembly protein I
MQTMQNDMLSQFRQSAYKLLYLQIILVLFVALISFIFHFSWRAGLSIILGGCAWIVPSFYFIYRVFKVKANAKIKTPLSMIKDFYVGEVLKLLISAVFVIIFVKFNLVDVKPFLLGYIITVLSAGIFPLILLKKVGKANGSAR